MAAAADPETLLSMASIPAFEPATLRSVPLFSRLADDQIRRVAGLVCRVRFAAGSVVAGDDRDEHALIIVVDGAIEVRSTGRGAAAPVTTRTLEAGRHTGEGLLLHDPEHSPLVVAARDVVVDQIRAREFQALLAETPELVAPLLWSLGEQLVERDGEREPGSRDEHVA